MTDSDNNTIVEEIFQKNTTVEYGIKAFLNPNLNSIDEIIYRVNDNSIISPTDLFSSNLTKKLLVSFDDRETFVEPTLNIIIFSNYRYKVCFG